MRNLQDIVERFPTIKDVVEIDFDSNEHGHSQEYDDDTSTFVCRIETRAYLIKFHWHLDARKSSANYTEVTSKQEITASQYQSYAMNGTRCDADKARENIALKAKLREKKERLTPKCPECGHAMEVKTNSAKQTNFWGCSMFRKTNCRGTRRGPNKAYQDLIDEIIKL